MRTLGSLRAALGVLGNHGNADCLRSALLCRARDAIPEGRRRIRISARELSAPRSAFVYGWMALLVMDPGLTAALGIGLAKYLLGRSRRTA
jgi:hypothetical protein